MKKAGQMIVTSVMTICLAAHAFGAEPKEPKLLKEVRVDKEIKKVADSVIITDASVLVLDQEGNIRKIKDLPERTRVEASKDGYRIGQRTVGAANAEFKMFDENGNVLWTSTKLASLVFHVSQASGGSVIARECYEDHCGNKIIIYDKQTPAGKTVSPRVAAGAQSIGSDVSGDGNYFAVVFRTFEEPKPTARQIWPIMIHQARNYGSSISKINGSGKQPSPPPIRL